MRERSPFGPEGHNEVREDKWFLPNLFRRMLFDEKTEGGDDFDWDQEVEPLEQADWENDTETETVYKYFPSTQERRELYRYCESIAAYLHDRKIPNLVIIDRSSRPVYIGVREYWHAKYADEKMPGMYFLNPKGFKDDALVSEWDRRAIAMDSLFKDDICEPDTRPRTAEEILDEFQTAYRALLNDKDQEVMIFDSCLHSGDTLSPVVDTMKKSGFKKLVLGSVNPPDPKSKIQTQYFITSHRPEKGCYPFDRDRLIEKTFEHVYSRPTRDIEKRKRSVELRHEIMAIMREQLSQE